MKIALIFATRPEIIKLWPLIKIFKKKKINFFSIHSGQHYSKNLNHIFFKSLRVPSPKYKQRIKLYKKAEESSFVGKTMIGIEKILLKEKPDLVIVQGDTNTALAGALATKKISNKKYIIGKHIKLAHVEAGLRSFDNMMSEEINRIMIDNLSDFLFAPTHTDYKNLINENIDKSKIKITGNTIIDALKESKSKIKSLDILAKFKLKKNRYFLITLHRPELVEYNEKLQKVLKILNKIGEMKNLPIIFPIHPRTKKNIKRARQFSAISFIEPIEYYNFLILLKNSKLVYTDSGGIQEEAYFFKTPCVTIRNNTERPQTVLYGKNILSGYEPKSIIKCTSLALKKKQKSNKIFGTGNASLKIYQHIKKIQK